MFVHIFALYAGVGVTSVFLRLDCTAPPYVYVLKFKLPTTQPKPHNLVSHRVALVACTALRVRTTTILHSSMFNTNDSWHRIQHRTYTPHRKYPTPVQKFLLNNLKK